MGSLSLACARYYTAQIVDAIEYMHDKDVIHRYLPPIDHHDISTHHNSPETSNRKTSCLTTNSG